MAVGPLCGNEAGPAGDRGVAVPPNLYPQEDDTQG